MLARSESARQKQIPPLRSGMTTKGRNPGLSAFVDGVVGLVAEGWIEGGVERGGGRGAELEIVLQRVGRVSVGGWDGGSVGGSCMLHRGGEPALAVVDVRSEEHTSELQSLRHL